MSQIEQNDQTNFLERGENASIIHQYENIHSRAIISPTKTTEMTQFHTRTGRKSFCDIIHENFYFEESKMDVSNVSEDEIDAI